MRKSILTLVVFLIGTLAVSAQWSSAGDGTGYNNTSANTSKRVIGFYRVGGSLSFNTLSGNYFDKNASGKVTGAINLARLGFFLGKNSPIYLGFGWDLPFKGWKEEVEINGRTFTTNYNGVGYRFPIFVGYQYPITQDFKVYGHTGPSFDVDFGYWGSVEYDGEKEDISSEDLVDTFRVLNGSWMFSAGITYKKLYVGLEYALPFKDIFDYEYVDESIKGKIGTFNICLGLNFDIKVKRK